MGNETLKSALKLIAKNAILHSDEIGAPWSGIHNEINAITQHFAAIAGTTQLFKGVLLQFI